MNRTCLCCVMCDVYVCVCVCVCQCVSLFAGLFVIVLAEVALHLIVSRLCRIFSVGRERVCNHPWANDPPNFNSWTPPNISPRPTEPSRTITSTSSSSVPTSHEPPIAHSIGSTTTTTATSTSGQTESPTVPARSSFSTARTHILQELRSGRWESVLLKQQLVLLMALTVNLAHTAKQMASHGLTDPITVFSQPRHSIFLCSNDPGVAVVGQFVSQSNNQARITANQWKGNRRTKKMDRRSRKGTARNSNHDDNERRLEKQPSSLPRTSTSSFVNFTKNQETTLTQSKFSKAERRKYHKTKERHAILLKKFRRDIGYVDACYEAKYEGRPLPKLVVAVGSYAFGFAGHVRGVAAGVHCVTKGARTNCSGFRNEGSLVNQVSFGLSLPDTSHTYSKDIE